jgi:flagellar motor switch/type III secretory pathway protein FliN
MELTQLARFMDVPLEIEALVEGPKMRVRDLLALKTGNIIETAVSAGENVEVRAGRSPLGAGELAASSGKVIVRVIRFRGDE